MPTLRLLPVSLLILFGLPSLIGHAASVIGVLQWTADEPGRTSDWKEQSPFIYPTLSPASDFSLALYRLPGPGEKPLAAGGSPIPLLIEGLAFQPSIIQTFPGATIEITNKSLSPMTILLSGTNQSVAVGPDGGKGTLKISTAGEYDLRVREFSHMKARLEVMDGGVFISTDAKGNFTAENLPGGLYKIRLYRQGRYEDQPFSIGESDHLSIYLKALSLIPVISEFYTEKIAKGGQVIVPPPKARKPAPADEERKSSTKTHDQTHQLMVIQ